MSDFFVRRPIAVTMCLLAISILGCVAFFNIPISLMPDIPIPQVTVRFEKENTSAREIETLIGSRLRRYLKQIDHIEYMQAHINDGQGVIQLRFQYGTNIDLAFIEVNEMIDRAMNELPRNTKRPKAIKASASDIPVLYLNLSLKPDNNSVYGQDSAAFLQLSDFATQVVRKRLERLKEVAIADISGQHHRRISIVPDNKKLETLKISLDELESHILRHNINLGQLLIQDGEYTYNVRFQSELKSKEDIENIYLEIDNRLFLLKELAKVIEHPQVSQGEILVSGKKAISMALIKKQNTRISKFKQALEKEIKDLKQSYPSVHFSIIRDQTQLLDYAISNLGQSLFLGILLAFLVMWFFLQDWKAPLLVGISIPAALLLTLLLFYLLDLSVNIITLSGLIIGVGMMVDNSIIVIDSIHQQRSLNLSLVQACVKGAKEVFTPMLSSVLTTCAVFVPLIFLGDMAGALFYEQALAISISLGASLLVSVTALPVYYSHFYKGSPQNEQTENTSLLIILEKGYHKVLNFTFRNSKLTLGLFFCCFIGAAALSYLLPKHVLPSLSTTETVLSIDWNDKISVKANSERCNEIIREWNSFIETSHLIVGKQEFMLDLNGNNHLSTALVYLKTHTPEQLEQLRLQLSKQLSTVYPNSLYRFDNAENIFNTLFDTKRPVLMVKLRPKNGQSDFEKESIEQLITLLKEQFPHAEINGKAWQEYVLLETDPLKLAAYHISPERIYKKLKSDFGRSEILQLTDQQQLIPVNIGSRRLPSAQVVQKATISGPNEEILPLNTFLETKYTSDVKTITTDAAGEFYPLNVEIAQEEIIDFINKAQSLIKQSGIWKADIEAELFESRKMIKRLMIILALSLLLLYCILAAQFNSLSLPIIILLEVPADIFGALLLLKLFGSSINLISLIGIVVMSGIVINDSILKVDTTNQLIKKGYSPLRALIEAGKRRLKPIIMTSLTTILALVPIFFLSGMGAELQWPLALAVIGGLTLGTAVSLFILPLLYILFFNRKPTPYESARS